MPDGFGFNHFNNNGGTPTVQCIHDGCDVSGPKYYWTDDKREIHYLTHVVSVNLEFTGDTRTDTCRICNGAFTQERKRGRPRVLCYSCKPE
jgi:hypothetical protein